MTDYIIDEYERAVNVLHYPHLYTDKHGSWYELRLPRNLYGLSEAEIIIGDTFLAYGGKRPEKYYQTYATFLRKDRWLARVAPSMPRRFYAGYIPAWRFPLVPVKKEEVK